MRILGNGTNVSDICGRKPNKLKNIVNIKKTAPKGVVLFISDKAKDFQIAMSAVREISEVREDKVKEFSKKYISKDYDVSSVDIADKFLESILEEEN